MTSLPVIESRPRPDRDALARELASTVEGEVRFGLHDRMLYATDASLYQMEPLGVVIPASVEDAVRAIEFCARRGLPVLPRGGGTSLAGQCTSEAVVIDFSAACTALLEVDAAGQRCRVESGITIDDLNDRLREQGLFFAPDPSTARQANVGGCIGNNAAGSHSILYGRTSDNVLGVDVCLADGRRVRLDEGAADRDPVASDLSARIADIVRRHEALIRERFPKTRRRSAGYQLDVILEQLERGDGALGSMNLAQLICGSEGTLAVTLGAELLLRPVPKAKGLAVVAFDELEDAIDAVGPLLELGPSAVELLDDMVIDLARKNTECRRYVELLPSPEGRPVRAVLYVEFYGERGLDEVLPRLEQVRAMFDPARVQTHTDAGAMARAWQLRKSGEPLLHGVPGERKPLGFVEDNAVPPERLGEFVRGFRSIVESRGTRAAFYAHASVGVLHVRPLLNIRDEEDRRRMHEIAVEVADLARSVGGVMSGEHGDGRVRGPLLERFFGSELMDAFREVKAVFDPEGRLNPGNIIDPKPIGSISERVRVRPEGGPARIPEVDTYFTYDDQHGFAEAVEMCNGAGVCRKKTGGTMCPSYMATMDERHSTRGRGNALRLAISGQLSLTPGSAAWNDPETRRTLDLCLSCKACKTECPSNVDIARLKAEYTAQGYREAGRVPLSARIFASVHVLNRLGSKTPGLANFVNGLPPVRAMINRLLGLHPDRSLPAFARPLARSFGGADAALPAGAPEVVLFGDCFTTCNEPSIGLATKRVFEAFGYRVRLESPGCCARPAISGGLLDRAIRDADRTFDRLSRVSADGRVKAVLVCEPSCLSAFKDDWLQMRMRATLEERRALAAKCFLPEEFLARAWEEHPRRPEFEAGEQAVIFHGHCHQKALWGAESSADALARVFGDRVRVLDSGCCGMAGSFGYTRERYGLSMRIGELSLFPAVRDRPEGSRVAATGTSCRHQVRDGTGEQARHPIELIADALR